MPDVKHLKGGLFFDPPYCILSLRKNGEIQMDPQNEALLSLTILLTGLVVVFAVLIFLILIINVYGNIIYKVTQKRHKGKDKTEDVRAPVSAPEPAPIEVEEGIPGEVVAAISAAVYMTCGDSAPVIRSVKRAATNPRSLWGEAGRQENTRPF